MSTLASVIERDVIANRPAAGIAGRVFFSSDESKTYRDNGASWDNVSDAGTGTAKYTTSWSALTSVTVTHGRGTTAVLVQVFDASGVLTQPETLTITDANTVTLTFGAAFTGSVVVIG